MPKTTLNSRYYLFKAQVYESVVMIHQQIINLRPENGFLVASKAIKYSGDSLATILDSLSVLIVFSQSKNRSGRRLGCPLSVFLGARKEFLI